MKDLKKFGIGFFSGVIAGVIGSLILIPNERENLRRSLSYKIKKTALNLFSFVENIAKLGEKPKNTIKEQSQKIIANTKDKANKVLQDINAMTKMN